MSVGIEIQWQSNILWKLTVMLNVQLECLWTECGH